MSESPPRSGKFPLRLEQMARPPKKLVGVLGGPAAAPSTTATQPHLAVAPRHGTRTASVARPTGLGLDSDGVRLSMVERLRAAGPHDARVLDAMAAVPRHLFVDAALVTQAYEDTSLPIGHGQTISKPSVVTRMIGVLMDGATACANGHLGKVLEVGTGCGYQAAVLCRLSRQVVSVERIRGLHDKARDLLAPLRMDHLRLVYGDGMLGHPPNAPYDSIIAAACGIDVPEAWLAQLAAGGRLISPVLDAANKQRLVVIDRLEDGSFQRTEYEAVQFVPLKSGSV